MLKWKVTWFRTNVSFALRDDDFRGLDIELWYDPRAWAWGKKWFIVKRDDIGFYQRGWLFFGYTLIVGK